MAQFNIANHYICVYQQSCYIFEDEQVLIFQQNCLRIYSQLFQGSVNIYEILRILILENKSPYSMSQLLYKSLTLCTEQVTSLSTTSLEEMKRENNARKEEIIQQTALLDLQSSEITQLKLENQRLKVSQQSRIT